MSGVPRVPAPAGAPGRWETLAPYAFVPALAGLVFVAWRSPVDEPHKTGVYLAAVALLVVILIRQVVVIRQNARLVDALRGARAELTVAVDEMATAVRRFELAAEATGDAVWDLDVKSGAVWWNSGPARLFGYRPDDVSGVLEWWEERIHPDDRERVANEFTAALEGAASMWTADYRFRRADGTYATVLDRGSIIRDAAGRATRAVGAMLDLSAQKEAERSLRDMNERLRHALHEVSERERVIAAQAAQLRASQEQLVSQERLRALGTMAAGIAHDLNNALAPVSGFAEILATVPGTLDDRTRARQYLSLIHTGAQDAAGVVRRLREFYRPRDAEDSFKPVLLHDLARDTIALTSPQWKDQALVQGRQIAVEASLPEVPAVLGDPAALREALTNLIFNAIDAMPSGGTLGVTLTAERDAASLTVSDTGVGMSDDVRRQCLEPFFTTKGERGSGLGLAMVHGIAQRHGADLQISSAPGAGTRVTIRLPYAAVERGEPHCSAGAAPEQGAALKGLRVLVVDDEPAVRATIAALLEVDGCEVSSADGAAALSALDEWRADVVVTDRAMPGMPGDQLALQVRERFPAVPVILVTGYGDLMKASRERPDGVAAVLSKPVSREALRGALVEVAPAAALSA